MLRNQTEIEAHFNAMYGLNIDRTTISKIINKKDKWLHVEGGSKTVFKHRRVKFPLLEKDKVVVKPISNIEALTHLKSLIRFQEQSPDEVFTYR